MVAKFESSGLYKERALVYTDAAGVSLKQYRYHFWTDSPDEMLQECLVRYLRDVGASPLVVEDYADPVKLIVGGHIRRFERVVTGNSVIGAVTLELSVKRRDSTAPMLVREYRGDIESAGSSVEQSADALAVALQHIYADFVDDLAKLLAHDK